MICLQVFIPHGKKKVFLPTINRDVLSNFVAGSHMDVPHRTVFNLKMNIPDGSDKDYQVSE